MIVLKDVSKFIKKTESMAKNINLSLFNEFFDLSPVDYVKYLINLKNTEEKKRICNWGKKQNISFKRQNKKNEQKRKKNKSANETLKIIKEILDYNKNAQRFFSVASEVDKGKSEPRDDKGKSEPKTDESIAERTKLRRERIAEIERKEKSINNKLFDYYFGYSNPSNIRNRLINV